MCTCTYISSARFHLNLIQAPKKRDKEIYSTENLIVDKLWKDFHTNFISCDCDVIISGIGEIITLNDESTGARRGLVRENPLSRFENIFSRLTE